MPEVQIRVRWSDGALTRCYSPSRTVTTFFEVGRRYELEDFIAISRRALEHASERVRERHGHPCRHALGEIQRLDLIAQQLTATPGAFAVVEGFDE